MPGLNDIFRLIRIVNCLLAMIAVGVGAYMTARSPVYYGPLVAALAVFFVCAAGNIFNDTVDIEIDRINRPRRVLVRGAVTTRQAYYLAGLCALASLILAVAVNYQVFALVLVALVTLAAYNLGLKRVPLLGNMLIALLAGLTFLTGGWAVDPELVFILPGPLVPALFGFLIHLDREILKDIQDKEGDKVAGLRTLPMIVGDSRALLIIIGIFVVLVLATIYPILAGWYGGMYKAICLYAVDLPVTALLIFVWGHPTPKMLTAASLSLKLVMGIGLIALLLA